MSTAAVALNTWSIEFHQTMVAAERARQDVEKVQERAIRFVAEVILWVPFHRVTNDTEKLIGLLEKLESYPSSILLEERAAGIPASLHELFRIMCDVIQEAKDCRLHNGYILKPYIDKLTKMSEQINSFAIRFEDAQNKLRSRVPAEDVVHFQESFAAYSNSGLVPDQADEEDVKRELLRF
jgi:hypothetical protein